ncbi:hypothetical protein RJT34_11547 [Clitoria ternatea]|uniref:DRBM domain-containing protein n=1 Tax=Clitoria ternatea TaxID=43366 RepID=A0AAN9JNT4_CLITE
MDSSPSQLPAPSPSPSPPPPLPSLPQQLMHKNNLEAFARRSNIAVPVYETVNKGQPHLPLFKSTVSVGGVSYTSQITFPHRKAAEQEAARLALENLLQKIRDEACSFVSENSTFCKSILHEYAAKLNLEKPVYNIVHQGSPRPVFTSSLVFNGTSYTGNTARSKKDAEQSAARAAILSILGNPDSGTTLIEISKSKSMLYDAIKEKALQDIHASTVLPTENTGNTSVTPGHKDVGVADCVVDNNYYVNEVEDPESSRMFSMCQEMQIPEQNPSPEVTTVASLSVLPQSGSAHSIDDGSSSKKRGKNKKKPNKKSRLESPLPITALPVNQVTPCSGAQYSCEDVERWYLS